MKSWLALSTLVVFATPASSTLLVVPLTFVSSAYVPVESMPGWLQPVVEANPITVLTEALRALTSGGPATGPVLQSIAWIGGLTLVFAPLAIRQYRRLA